MFIDNDTRGMTGNDGEKGERVRERPQLHIDNIRSHKKSSSEIFLCVFFCILKS